MPSHCARDPRRIAGARCLDRLWMQDLLLHVAFDRASGEHRSRKISRGIPVEARGSADVPGGSAHSPPTREVKASSSLDFSKTSFLRSITTGWRKAVCSLRNFRLL